MNKQQRNIYVLIIVIANMIFDQFSKYEARLNIAYDQTINVIGKHFILTKIENSGAFLSTGDSLEGSVKFIFLSLLPLIALSYGIYYLLRHPYLPRLLAFGISFVIGGGLGNLYDRIVYGSVTDFMHVDFLLFKTGIFNLADVSIMVGMVMIIINLYVKRPVPELLED
ncbi:signal peptidase II [Pedobacter sp. L105]|uniref:signal peptidase II n=1 Tax=Pedobacter sp. L105 TaxID=1641871 RepID=UPI00131EB88E|nr:signal peptidase II [Pedobacter sp. L105]